MPSRQALTCPPGGARAGDQPVQAVVHHGLGGRCGRRHKFFSSLLQRRASLVGSCVSAAAAEAPVRVAARLEHMLELLIISNAGCEVEPRVCLTWALLCVVHWRSCKRPLANLAAAWYYP